VIAVQLPGWENLRAIEARGDLTFADPATDPALARALTKASPATDTGYYFAAPVSREQLTNMLKA